MFEFGGHESAANPNLQQIHQRGLSNKVKVIVDDLINGGVTRPKRIHQMLKSADVDLMPNVEKIRAYIKNGKRKSRKFSVAILNESRRSIIDNSYEMDVNSSDIEEIKIEANGKCKSGK